MTLTEEEHKRLNDSAIKIIRELKIEGGCNVQFALEPVTGKYYLIEVNPRVSRSSALASKASGYPIARVTAKIAVGMTLDEIEIAETTAACEPVLDYVVAKVPRFPFDKDVYKRQVYAYGYRFKSELGFRQEPLPGTEQTIASRCREFWLLQHFSSRLSSAAKRLKCHLEPISCLLYTSSLLTPYAQD